MNEPCFSVIIVCYRHFEYLYSAIDSVLSQEYGNIELIISDDGSAGFPKDEIQEYIESKRSANIKSFLVRQEEMNCGTVKHLNHAISICSGDYIIALAGDDMLYDEKVLTSYVQGFQSAPDNCYIEMAQTGMFDEKMKTLEGYYLVPSVKDALQKTATDSSDLMRLLLLHGACLPSTSTCFQKSFFDKFGLFDERFRIMEDYPMHVRLAEEGWIIHYENFVAIKHRSGGISHGQKGALASSSTMYFLDMKRSIETIVLPRIKWLTKEEAECVNNFQKKQARWIDFRIAKDQKNWLALIGLALCNPGYTFRVIIQKLWPIAYRMHVRLILFCCALWFFIPTIGSMIGTLTKGCSFAVSAIQVERMLYPISWVLFGFWCFIFVVWVINRIIQTIQRFPSEALAIG